MRAALSCVVLLIGGCGLQGTEATRDERPASIGDEVSPAVVATAPETSIELPTPPRRDPVRAVQPRVERDGAVLVSYAGSATPEPVRSAHLAQVQRLRCDDQRVDYPQQFDDWHSLDLDGDGSNEHLVFFTLEGFGGGNNYVRYLVAYRYVQPVWFASYAGIVGGKGGAGVSGAMLRLANGLLSTEAMLPDDDDGTCCPSIESEIEFDVGAGGALTPRPIALSEAGSTYQFMLGFAASCG